MNVAASRAGDRMRVLSVVGQEGGDLLLQGRFGPFWVVRRVR